MEFFLVQMLAFLRPVMSIHTGLGFAGVNLFELAAIAFSAMIAAAFGIRAAVRKDLNLSAIDLAIVGFVLWCVAVYAVYPDESRVNILAKFIIPPLTYLVAKSVIPDRVAYRRLLRLLIFGFSIPIFASAGLILAGGGIENVSFWTGVPRYEGVYYGAHDMGHNAALLLMVAWLYLLLPQTAQAGTRRWPPPEKAILALLVFAALFLLYMARVRTAVLGIGVFAATLIWLHYRRPSLVLVASLIVGLNFAFSEDIQKRFFPELARAEQINRELGLMGVGSNRPRIWREQTAEFFDLPIDHQLAGIGIGNTLAQLTGRMEYALDWDTHNDFLRVMVHTGIVGFLIFMGLQWLILKRILNLEGGDRWAFLALFLAVAAMNLVSNSYVARFGLAQMLYLVLAYIELPSGRAARETVRDARPRGSIAFEPANGRALGASREGHRARARRG